MRQWLERNRPYFPAAFFVGGFVFDLVTLSRIDENFQLIQQFIYLLIIGFFLVYEKSPRVEGFFSTGRRSTIWSYRAEAVHFILGALLSVYMIFYFKSASVWNSFVFIGGLAALLVLNEFERIKGLGDVIRFALFSLCSVSYFVYLVPILWQHVGFFTFLFSIIASGIFITFFLHRISKYEHLDNRYLFTKILLPSVSVHVIFLVLYIFRLLPPVPLSIEKIGIYHDIKKSNGEYQLFYDRPAWKVWQKGAQSFAAVPGDKIYCFASVFAPHFFKDQIAMEWWWYGKNGWMKTDSIPMQISGGRDQGFRGYTVKSNYDPGEWQIRVMTSDQRELGRIYFDVQKEMNHPGTHEMALETY
jgi:hypothetical protein